MKFQSIPVLCGLAATALAHGEPTEPAAIAKRNAQLKRTADALASSCANKLSKRSPEAIAKRQARTNDFVNKFLQARGQAPNFQSSNGHLFTKKQSTCVLAPEQEEGPFYVDGMLVRDDVTEDEPGIDLLLDVNVVDSTNCEPVTNVIFDFWCANSTGKYSDEQSEGTLGETYLRGLVEADDEGVVQVATKVPGWYGGRAQHIHIKAHLDYTINSDGTISGGTVPHTGQVFFDQDLLTEINVLWPYTLDTNQFTLNSADGVIQQQALTTEGYDPYIDMTYVGDDVSAGLLGEITIVIDTSATDNDGNVGGGSGGGGGFPGRRL